MSDTPNTPSPSDGPIAMDLAAWTAVVHLTQAFTALVEHLNLDVDGIPDVRSWTVTPLPYATSTLLTSTINAADTRIATKLQGLRSVRSVQRDDNGRIAFVIDEPARGASEVGQ